MTNKRTIYRQGDVLLELVTAMPDGTTEIQRDKHRGLVLQEGEVTGHAHRIPSRHAALYRSETDARYLRVMGPAPVARQVTVPTYTAVDEDGEEHTVPEHIKEVLDAAAGGAVLEHEEHTAIVLPPGDYRVTIHAEYSPGELPRQVAD